MILKLLKNIRYFLIRTGLLAGDKLAAKLFINSNFDSVVEMGVHQGEIAQVIANKKCQYIGYEANPHNIEKYKLDNLNVKNFAVVPSDYKKKEITLNIPIRNKGDDMSSGKSSILTRKLDGWHKSECVTVNTIKVEEIAPLHQKEKLIGVWIDIEGISTAIANEIAELAPVKFIHFEYDIYGEDYHENVQTNIEPVSKNFNLIRFRTSHNQYNYFATKEKNLPFFAAKLLAEVLNLYVTTLLLPSRILKN